MSTNTGIDKDLSSYRLTPESIALQVYTNLKIKDKDGKFKTVNLKVPTATPEAKILGKEFKGFGTDVLNPFNVISKKALDSGLAFVTGELEKRDATLYDPLVKYYWQEIPLRTGGGAVDFLSFLNVNWGTTSTNNGYVEGNTDALDTVSVDISKTIGKVRMWAKLLRIGYKDMLQSNHIGRSLEDLLSRGITVAYHKELDQVSMLGWESLNVPGLYNNPNIAQTLYPDGVSTSSLWANKTADEILEDVNLGITTNWANSEFDPDGLPDSLYITPAIYGSIITRKVSDAGNISILQYILANNVAQDQKVPFRIHPNRYSIDSGATSLNRSIYFRNNDTKLRFHLPVPLTRAFTTQDANKFAYMTPYYAFISQMEFVYPETLSYFDGN